MTTRLPLRTRGLAALPALSMLLLGAPIPAYARVQAPDGSSTVPSTVGTAMRGSTPGGGELVGDENAGGVGSGPLPHNTCRKAPRGTRFTVTLPKETELEDLINWMMTITCQKFIWDRKVRSGKVTIMSPEPVTVDEAYAAFYAALETMGLTVEPSGKYFKIVETTDAKNRTLPLYGEDANAPNSDRFVTQLIRIKHGATKDISDVLNQLKSKQGSVDVIGNLIILTDKGSSIRRLEQIVVELDTPTASEKIFFYQLQFAKAEEVAQIIRDIFGEGSKGEAAPAKGKGSRGGSPTSSAINRVIVDERSGTLIVITNEADYVIIRKLIERLDVKLPGGGGRIHVRKLRNADAQEVATVLSALATGAKQAAQAGGDKNKAAAGPVSADLFSGDVKITPDQATRSLVIIASASDYKNLEPVIDKLDMERRQLYIEIYMLEISIKHSTDVGAGAHFGAGFDVSGQTAVALVGSAPTSALNSLILSPEAFKGLAGGLVGPLIPGTGQLLGTGRDIPGFGAVIQALQSSSDVNVVSEPHMYAADNQEATIEVGRNVPTQGALSFGGAGGGSGLVPLQSIERQDVTLRIKVKPYINDERNVTMDVEVEDRDIADTSPTLGVTTTKRRFKLDKIVGRDGQPFVLGGLIRDRESETVNQVPGLGSIPLLGWLFKSRQKAKEKVNLLLVMVPHIIDSPDDVRRIHERRDKERLEFIERETNFKRRELPSNVNYRKKAGLLASIDKEARRMEQEEIQLRRAEEEMRREIITGVLGMSPRLGGGDDSDDGGGGSQPAVTTPTPPPAVRREP
ncbi:type II secretion system secretin GspD [Nannocystis sp.]|uniref:type II secretion system secretin GspD n=1 Tax=Nannocystis sp. TaxID=1962667 RepID=UPI002428AB89|nr:type II secretion system secretin GspD [Nannocystis sp.]MBK7830452.1 type II secretion system secretin GspD [Nannocystis sp.]MBK9757201.1 type II secretion system secretin GspD [Nannocystis sp.]